MNSEPNALPVPVAATAAAGTPSPDNPAEKKRSTYNKLVREARLISFLVEKVNFNIHPEVLGVSKALLTRDLSGKKQVLVHGADDGTCIANIVWNINIRLKRRVLVRCSASYIITYDGMAGFPEETTETFIETVAKAATYPYFRALYAHLDWSASLGSAPLPILKFQANV